MTNTTAEPNFRAVMSAENGHWIVESQAGRIAGLNAWFQIADCGPVDDGDRACGHDARDQARKIAEAMEAAERTAAAGNTTKAYAALTPGGEVDPDSVRNRIEDCCHDARTEKVAEVEIRVTRRFPATPSTSAREPSAATRRNDVEAARTDERPAMADRARIEAVLLRYSSRPHMKEARRDPFANAASARPTATADAPETGDGRQKEPADRQTTGREATRAGT